MGPEFQINTYTTGDQRAAAVAADANGNFVVVWSSPTQDGSGFGIFGQRYSPDGAPSGPEFRVNTYTTGDQRYPAVATDSSGDFVVAWTSNTQDGAGFGIFGQRFAGTGAPLGPEFRINTFTTGDQIGAAVGSDGSGNVVVAWSSNGQDGSSFGVFGQRYASGGAPLGPEFRVNTVTTDYQLYPSVAHDGSGAFVVVWSSMAQDGSDFGVFGQRFGGAGTPLGPEFRVNTYTTYAQYRPSVASGASGDFVVLWSSTNQDGFNEGVFGQRYANTGTPLGPEFRVNTFTPYGQRFPEVAMDIAGNFVVVWSSVAGAQDPDEGIYGQRYDGSGVAGGPEFLVNTYTFSAQSSPDVASDPAGNFVVVWMGNASQDGSGFGIFGQRYGRIVPVQLMGVGIE